MPLYGLSRQEKTASPFVSVWQASMEPVAELPKVYEAFAAQAMALLPGQALRLWQGSDTGFIILATAVGAPR